MTLTDGDVAALAEQAVAGLTGRVDVRIEPDAGDDPYRWGRHSWLVHFTIGTDGAHAVVRLTADDAEDDAAQRLAEAVTRLTGGASSVGDLGGA